MAHPLDTRNPVKRGSTMTVRIRRGTEADIDDIVCLSHAIWRHRLAQQLGVGFEHWPMIAALMRTELIPIARTILVAERGGQIVGYSHRDRAMIEDLWIDPPFQRAGIGPRLLRAQVEAIAADGYRTASLECLEVNVHARRFYEREGWRPVYRYSRPSPLFRSDIPRIRYEYDVWQSAQSRTGRRARRSAGVSRRRPADRASKGTTSVTI
jgi:ribosomal protein S18 acetylase RimI-like enzyme